MHDEPLDIVVTPAGLVITPDTYRTHAQHHEIADRVMARYGYTDDEVTEMRITEHAIDVDVHDRDQPGHHVRTDHHDLRTRGD